MATVTLKGNTVKLKGELPEVGSKAPDFTLVKPDLQPISLSDLSAKVKVLIAVPSLDTGICAMEAKKFNQELDKIEGVKGIVISRDLPFAMRRFCEVEGIKNIITASDYREGKFVKTYNTELMESGMAGLSARAIFVLDEKNTIKYIQLVPEIAQEPDYEAVLAAVKKLL